MTNRQLLEEGWKSYAEAALSKRVGRVQYVETRRAFYAGAMYLLRTVARSMSEGNDCQDSDLELMDDINSELKEFFRKIGTAEE